jgi:hypothetical protein
MHKLRQLKPSYFQLSLIVAAILTTHWLTMHCVAVCWYGGEGTVTSNDRPIDRPSATAQDADLSSRSSSDSKKDDGWRRTASGWERIDKSPEHAHRSPMEQPSQHFSFVQIWPAAAAACMLLLIMGLSSEHNTARNS